MSIHGDLHAALMAQVETITGYEVIWPRKGGDKPDGEHLVVYHVPNDNDRQFLGSNDPLGRKGFIVIILVMPLGDYQAVSEAKAGDIEDMFPLDSDMTFNGTTVSVHNRSVKRAGEVERRWETPIWIEYRGTA